MSRERTLTIAGGLVALGMAGLISITAVNGRWLGLPSHYTQGDVGITQLARELRGLVLRQARYRERQRRYTTDLAELDFDPSDPRITVTVQAADREGWTAVATSREAGVACVMRVGFGPAANVRLDPLSIGGDVGNLRVETCEVMDSSVSPAEILGVLSNHR